MAEAAEALLGLQGLLVRLVLGPRVRQGLLESPLSVRRGPPVQQDQVALRDLLGLLVLRVPLESASTGREHTSPELLTQRMMVFPIVELHTFHSWGATRGTSQTLLPPGGRSSLLWARTALQALRVCKALQVRRGLLDLELLALRGRPEQQVRQGLREPRGRGLPERPAHPAHRGLPSWEPLALPALTVRLAVQVQPELLVLLVQAEAGARLARSVITMP